jgi:hypothetical protein
MPKAPSDTVPAAMRAVFDPLAARLDAFCAAYLNQEYAQLARRTAAALARKRPSPLSRGSQEVWAAGILHAVGSVNFLFDPSQTPHLRASDIAEHFGVAASTAGNKSKQIRDALKMSPFDHRWNLPSRLADSAMAWFVEIDGFVVDARTLPRALQEQAFRQGLIPWIPADQPGPGEAGADQGGSSALPAN